MKKAVRFKGENEDHELPLPEMNNKIAMFTKRNTPKVEDLEKDVKDLKKRTSKMQTITEEQRKLERKVNKLMKRMDDMEGSFVISPPEIKNTE